MRVLVSGAAGMIGSHVVDALIARGDEVIALDDLSRGDRANLNRAARFACIDVRDAEALAVLAAEVGPLDAVVHQASIINEGIDAENIDIDLGVNVRGTLNLIDFARKVGARRFVYASSVAVYGRPEILPAREDATLPTPIASYGIGKLAAEHYLRYAAESEPGLTYAALRYANIYGPRQALLGEVGAIRFFVENIVAGRPVHIHGDGEQCRDFLYVDDCVAVTLKALDSDENLVLNVGSGHPTTVNQVVAALGRVLGSPLVPERLARRHGEIGRFWCDTEKAAAKLGWTPVVDLDVGIGRTLEWRQGVL